MNFAEWLKEQGVDPSPLPAELQSVAIASRLKVGKDLYRPGKFLRRVEQYLPLNDKLRQAFLKLVEHAFDFGYAKGPEVYSIYADDTVSSCMTGMDEYLAIYAENPEQVAVAYASKNGNVYARALVWAGKYYDKLYYANRESREALQSFLRAEGLKLVPHTFHIKLKKPSTGEYPYIDTLYHVYVSPEDHDHVVLAGDDFHTLEVDGLTYTIAYLARSTQGDLIRLHSNQLYCAVCGQQAVEIASDHLPYCSTHARDLAWVFRGGQVLRLYLANRQGYVQLENGYWTPQEEAATLLDGSVVHVSQLPEGYVQLQAGAYRGRYAKATLTEQYNGLWVLKTDIIDGVLSEVNLHTFKRVPEVRLCKVKF